MAANMSNEMYSRRDLQEAAPKFHITVEERPTYTYACIHSNDPKFQPSPEHIGRILDHCARPGCERIIIDNITGASFCGDDFLQSATQFPGFGLVHTRVAIVDPHGPCDHIDGMVIVIGRLSSIRVRVFPHLNQAEDWMTAH